MQRFDELFNARLLCITFIVNDFLFFQMNFLQLNQIVIEVGNVIKGVNYCDNSKDEDVSLDDLDISVKFL